MELTSIDYARLLSWLAYYKHNTILNKTQMQKLLFMCYGIFYAYKNIHLFTDDAPKAWPYGPVFPRVNVRYNPNSIPSDLTDKEKNSFLENKDALFLANNIINNYVNVSAHSLSEWSHEKGSPWFKTIYGEDGGNTDINWNQPIPERYIKEYFSKWTNLAKRK